MATRGVFIPSVYIERVPLFDSSHHEREAVEIPFCGIHSEGLVLALLMAAALMRDPKTSVAEVCKAFDFSKATLYRHVTDNGFG